MRKFYVFLYILISLSSVAYAQQNERLIDVDFRQANISQVVSELKAKTGYHFYYDPIQLDSLSVTLTLAQKSLTYILDKAFENTAYHYVITNDQEVILTKGSKIIAALPPGYFYDQPAPPTADAPVADYAQDDNKKVIGASAENRTHKLGTRTNNRKAGNVILSGYVHN